MHYFGIVVAVVLGAVAVLTETWPLAGPAVVVLVMVVQVAELRLSRASR